MLFDIKKKEKKIFGMELSEATRDILKTFAINYSEIGDNTFKIINSLPEFVDVPVTTLREQYEKYAKIIYRRYIIKSVAEIVGEYAAIGIIIKNTVDIAYDAGINAGVKATLDTPVVKELQKQTRYRTFDDIYHEALNEGQAVITCDFDDGSYKKYIIATIQDEIPEIKKEA